MMDDDTPLLILNEGLPRDEWLTDERGAELFRLVIEGRIGDSRIPQGVHLVSAGNRPEPPVSAEDRERIDRVLRERAPAIIFQDNGEIVFPQPRRSGLPMLDRLMERSRDLHLAALADLAVARKQ